MIAIRVWTATAASVALLAGLAVAQDRGRGTEGTGARSPSAGAGGTSSPGNTGVGAITGATAPGCEHQMTGTVKRLDKAAGTLSIDVAGTGEMQLTLPPSELEGFEQGDQVIVAVGVRGSGARGDRGTGATR